MAITDSWILPKDVVFVPVAALTPEIRAQITCDEDDVAITRPRSRTPSKIVDAQAAALIQEFRDSSTIVNAVLRYSQKQQADPQETLVQAYPLLEKLLRQRLLVDPESAEAVEIASCYQVGECIAGCEIERVIQVLEDTELYQAWRDGRRVAVKIVRPAGGRDLETMFAREAAILQYLNGTVSPRLHDTGVWEGSPYIVLEWCEGAPVGDVAAGLRQRRNARERLHRLCAAILEAYARLHAQGVLHGDIHPRNILVTDSGQVTLIDFGYGRLEDRSSPYRKAPRAGVPYFFEPEYVRARQRGKTPPQVTAAGEQYAVAALLYTLLAGSNYLDFAAEKAKAMRQIVEETPLPFAHHSREPWPEVEALLERALSKDPSGRFSSMAAWAQMWQTAAPDILIEDTERETAGRRLLEQTLHQARRDGTLYTQGLPEGPRCSVTFGAAGIAYALYRIAQSRNDPSLLALADAWITRAEHDMTCEDAFYNPAMEVTPEIVEPVSLYHMPPGVYCVAAMIGHARGDFPAFQLGVDNFLRTSQGACKNLDLTLGRMGVLLGAAFLLDVQQDLGFADPEPLRAHGNAIQAEVWSQLDTYPPIPRCDELRYLGIAHGWAGLLYATLVWCQIAGTPLPAQLETRLEQLAELAEPVGAGVRWPILVRSRRRMQGMRYLSGWCNGSAGYVPLWTRAHRRFQDARYLDLAERAASNAWETDDGSISLCCGDAGRAYGLLALYRHTGESVWLRRAQELTARAAAAGDDSALLHFSLYKGSLGVAVLTADIEQPELAHQPLFEPAVWIDDDRR
jgi:serine/threonine-protein kinase